MTADTDVGGFARLIDVLRPWQEDLLLVGGWAHRLYRHHEGATAPPHALIQTNDADLALATRIKGDIGAALRDAGFAEALSGDHVPPVSEYRLGEEEHGFFAEFIAPLSGSGVHRDGSPDATLTTAGITAQKLRYLDVLFVQPWAIEITKERGFPISPSALVRIPNPACFIAQKLLIQRDRPMNKQAQDTLYIHDTLELFAGSLDALRTQWQTATQNLEPSAVRRVTEEIGRRFDVVTDAIRGAVRIPLDRRLDPAIVRRVCRSGLDGIFMP